MKSPQSSVGLDVEEGATAKGSNDWNEDVNEAVVAVGGGAAKGLTEAGAANGLGAALEEEEEELEDGGGAGLVEDW